MEHLKEILFIEIETVPMQSAFDLLPARMQNEWGKKAKTIKIPDDAKADPATLFSEKAGVYSEFSKVVCIGFGSLNNTGNSWKMRLKYLVNHDEKDLLNNFAQVVTKFSQHYKEFKFCGHNIKEFDIPFLCRRMLINGINLPDCMQLAGKKPWEVTHLDTMDIWRFGDFKNYTTLSLLAALFGIPSPKNDIDGSMVSHVYYFDKDLDRIGKYCLQDVLTSAKVFLKLKGYFDIDVEPVFL